MNKINVFAQLRTCLQRAKTYAAGLVGELAETVAGAIEELDSAKQDKLVGTAGKVVGFDANGNAEVQDILQAGALPITGGTMTGNLRLKNNSNYGMKINFGDGEYVYIHEPSDDHLEIRASYLNFLVSNGAANFTLNGAEIIREPIKGTVTIPTSGWSDDGAAGYPKYYDIAVSGVAAKDRAEITIAPGSLTAAKSCGLSPTNETLGGLIRIRSANVPTTAISAEYWVESGKE